MTYRASHAPVIGRDAAPLSGFGATRSVHFRRERLDDQILVGFGQVRIERKRELAARHVLGPWAGSGSRVGGQTGDARVQHARLHAPSDPAFPERTASRADSTSTGIA